MLYITSKHFKYPLNQQAVTAAEFGNAWATDARECVGDTGEPACEEDSEAEKEALDLCSVLTSVIGMLLDMYICNCLRGFSG